MSNVFRNFSDALLALAMLPMTIVGILIATLVIIIGLMEYQHILEAVSWLLGFGLVGAVIAIGLIMLFLKMHK